jgi:Zn-dependent protease
MALLLGLGVYAILKRDLIDGDDLLFFAVLFPSIILHEVSHGAAAKAFGDDTAEQAGRLTLNPLAHIDPWGSILLPALLILTTGAAFGYAKPVPVNPRKMRSPRNQGMLTALAGPATNITLCVLAAAVIRFGNLHVGDGLLKPVFTFGYVNVILAAFNLIPLPPLDGSAVVERLLPRSLWPGYLRLRQYSMGLVLLLVFVFPLNRVFDPAYNLWTKLL